MAAAAAAAPEITPSPCNASKKKPSLFGRFELGKLLGHGGFSKVYVARDIKTGESVAIKVIEKKTVLKSGLMENIKREIAVLRRVRHPYIVELFEVMATKSKIYFVMEYVNGGVLLDKIENGGLEEEITRKYFQQLISAVEFCHSRGVYHRDLKPDNILIDKNGDIKVSDFGLSAISDQIHKDGLFHTCCGTPGYVAPEVLSCRGYDAAKSDIWSCGVILFALMAGYLPFYDRNLLSMYRKIYKGEFTCPSWFSDELITLLHRFLDTNPDKRIAIPETMNNKWFKKGFKQVRFYMDEHKSCTIGIDSLSSDHSLSESDSDSETGNSLPRPASLNAFDIISFSRSFNLSNLFEEDECTRYVSDAPVSNIISKFEEIAKFMSFTVRKRDCRVDLEGSMDGVKGGLSIETEIFELTPCLRMIEVRKKVGDTEEYNEFCNSKLKIGLDSLSMGSDSSNNFYLPSDTE